MAGVTFGLLGPLRVRLGDEDLRTLPGKQRVLLAALLLRPNRRVSLDELADAFWGAQTPPSARGTLRDYVKELRKALGEDAAQRIRTVPGGYQIEITPEELDVARFESLLASASADASRGSWPAAAGQLKKALALWRGDPLADIPSDQLALREIPRLAELHGQALESSFEADLQLGRHTEAIAGLRQQVTLYPLREHLRALLMLALYRDGRQAEALAAYREVRGLLVEELGTEPGTELSRLHHQILAGDPALASPPQGRESGQSPDARLPAGAVTPRQLPAAVSHFTGRTAELAALSDMMAPAGRAARTVLISALAGTAGVGKTAAAVYWAQGVADQFPDGQLYVNLRGYDPADPLDPAEALAGFMRALGCSDHQIPADPEERAARYRSLLAGRRALLLLDNAGSADQVRPLLPGTPDCAVIVTSRDALSGLVARDGVRRLDLDLLPLDDAAQLLRVLIGSRADADLAAAQVLAACCGRLPLALRVAAEMVAARPAAPLADLASELADVQGRLDLLDAGGDQRTAVRAVFSWSYQHLDAGAARAFRLLGLYPGPDFGPDAVAALAAVARPQAQLLTGALERAHLVHAAGTQRYAMHDLMKAYASGQAAEEETPERRQEAGQRLLRWYLRKADAARVAMSPQRFSPLSAEPAVESEQFADYDEALAWLDAEHASLLSAVDFAARQGEHEIAWKLPGGLWNLYSLRGNAGEWLHANRVGLASARHAGDQNGEMLILNHLAANYLHNGQPEAALDCLREQLALVRVIGPADLVANSLVNIGVVLTSLHRSEAMEALEEALEIYSGSGNQSGQAYASCGIGAVLGERGAVDAALSYYERGLAFFREAGALEALAELLADISELSLRHGRPEDAIRDASESVALCLRTGSLRHQARALAVLGQAGTGGQPEQARQHLLDAIAIFTELGDPRAGELAAGIDQVGQPAG